MDYAHEYAAAKALAEERLNGLFRAGGLEEAMRYSLLAGGKRVRPVLALKFCQACGAPMEAALDFACAVELIHTYSLIHDDLPGMDNDDFRRGRPTNHRVFGESTAIIAGDALQSAAFGLIAGAGRNVAPGRLGAVTEAVRVLAEAAGERGMCLGQFRDTTVPESERNEAVLTDINRRKTGALIKAACLLGILGAKTVRDVPEGAWEAAEEYAENVGLAFQIEDDLLDVISTREALGKDIGSDSALGKVTYMTLLGEEGCRREIEKCTLRAVEALEKGPFSGEKAFLIDLSSELAQRNY